MSDLIGHLWKYVRSKRFDSDGYDRVSHYYSVLLLVILLTLVGGRQLVDDRIRCYTPSEFTYHQTFYVNDYCYAASTYYVPENGMSLSLFTIL